MILYERDLLASVDCPFVTGLKLAFQTDAEVTPPCPAPRPPCHTTTPPPPQIFFALDLKTGGDLEHYLLGLRRPFSEPEARFLGAEVLLGILHLHERGVMHRDIKPANILLDAAGHASIADLGMCTFFAPLPQAGGGSSGSPAAAAAALFSPGGLAASMQQQSASTLASASAAAASSSHWPARGGSPSAAPSLVLVPAAAIADAAMALGPAVQSACGLPGSPASMAGFAPPGAHSMALSPFACSSSGSSAASSALSTHWAALNAALGAGAGGAPACDSGAPEEDDPAPPDLLNVTAGSLASGFAPSSPMSMLEEEEGPEEEGGASPAPPCLDLSPSRPPPTRPALPRQPRLPPPALKSEGAEQQQAAAQQVRGGRVLLAAGARTGPQRRPAPPPRITAALAASSPLCAGAQTGAESHLLQCAGLGSGAGGAPEAAAVTQGPPVLASPPRASLGAGSAASGHGRGRALSMAGREGAVPAPLLIGGPTRPPARTAPVVQLASAPPTSTLPGTVRSRVLAAQVLAADGAVGTPRTGAGTSALGAGVTGTLSPTRATAASTAGGAATLSPPRSGTGTVSSAGGGAGGTGMGREARWSAASSILTSPHLLLQQQQQQQHGRLVPLLSREQERGVDPATGAPAPWDAGLLLAGGGGTGVLACERAGHPFGTLAQGVRGKAGTPGFWAPEMLHYDADGRGSKYGPAVDWWSFGCLLYAMLTARGPFSVVGGDTADDNDATLNAEPDFSGPHFSQAAVDLLQVRGPAPTERRTVTAALLSPPHHLAATPRPRRACFKRTPPCVSAAAPGVRPKSGSTPSLPASTGRRCSSAGCPPSSRPSPTSWRREK